MVESFLAVQRISEEGSKYLISQIYFLSACAFFFVFFPVFFFLCFCFLIREISSCVFE